MARIDPHLGEDLSLKSDEARSPWLAAAHNWSASQPSLSKVLIEGFIRP